MFRNYLVTALNNLARNRLYAAITILGLAVAFTGAILVGQFVRNELTYDHWIPGHGRVYALTTRIDLPAHKPILGLAAPDDLTGRLKTEFPGVATVVRLRFQPGAMRQGPGDRAATEWLTASVDPDFFKVLSVPALAGDPASALQQPDTVVLTRRMARKYFGRDAPIGQTLETQAPDRKFHAMRVTAVLRDFPVNTTLGPEIFISARSAWSNLGAADDHALPVGAFRGGVETYARLSPGVSFTDLQHALEVAGRPDVAAPQTGGARLSLHLVPLDDVHWLPSGGADPGAKAPGDKTVVYGIAAVAALMVLVAAINFVTLMTARAARRGVEVGVRKATGAGRGDLIIQFMGEALIQVAASVLIAAALAEELIKPFDALVQRDLSIDFVHDPALPAGIAAFALVVGVLASIYPALVLSSFRPQAVLKGGTVRTAGSPLARATMVAIQFAVLVGLIFMTTTIYRQTRFALGQGIGAADRSLIVEVPLRPGSGPFLDEVRKLPGVSAAVRSTSYVLQHGIATPVNLGQGAQREFWLKPTDFGFLELNGVRPLAGRLFSRAHGEDGVLAANPDAPVQPPVVINEAAARVLGYAHAQAAIGQPLAWTRAMHPGAAPVPGRSEIIGVVPDMPETVRTAVDPELYFVDPQDFDLISIKLTGQDVLGTMGAIASVWKRTGDGSPFSGTFLSQIRLNSYAEIVIQGEAMAICAGLSILLAGLGLFALSAFMTERRTKEIGIRKAMGAGKWDVMALLLWQFTIPVLCAVAVAAPVGFLAMHHWLSQFAYRAPLSLWTLMLAAAAAVAIAIAWSTVAYQSYVVARAKPAGALQYE